MFLDLKDKIINLRNVSNINILKNSNRIVFNMNYGVEITTKKSRKTISDYVYLDGDFESNLKALRENEYIQRNFIAKLGGQGYINLDEISSIKFSESKKRVIFNLSHPVTFTDFDGNEKITSEFVYVNCFDQEDYNTYIEYIRNGVKHGNTHI